MFGLGFWEIAIILGVALLVLGPSKLPDLARSLGKGLREFRKATEDFKSTIEDEVNRPDPRPKIAHNDTPAQIVPPERPLPQEAPPPAAIAPPLDQPATEQKAEDGSTSAGPTPADVAAPAPTPDKA